LENREFRKEPIFDHNAVGKNIVVSDNEKIDAIWIEKLILYLNLAMEFQT